MKCSQLLVTCVMFRQKIINKYFNNELKFILKLSLLFNKFLKFFAIFFLKQALQLTDSIVVFLKFISAIAGLWCRIRSILLLTIGFRIWIRIIPSIFSQLFSANWTSSVLKKDYFIKSQ